MVSKFALLSSLFLAFVVPALNQELRDNPDWAGAMCTPSLSTPYNYISADFDLPDVYPEPPDAIEGGVRFGVALGDLGCSTAVLSTVQLTVVGGESYYFPVYGSQLNTVYNLTSKGLMGAGDHIRVVVYISTVVGLAIVENHTAGWTTSSIVPLPNRRSFCGGAAQWIVQDYKETDSERYVPLENFVEVVFYRCIVSTPNPDHPDECVPGEARETSWIQRGNGPPLTYGGVWKGNVTTGFTWSGNEG